MVFVFVGVMCVFVGLGFGKMYVFIGCVVYLIYELKMLLREILCITFTNKAARELRERLRDKIGDVVV